MNYLRGIIPAIYNNFKIKTAKGGQLYEAKNIKLTYDRRHNNKRGWDWWAKKTGFRLKHWSENL